MFSVIAPVKNESIYSEHHILGFPFFFSDGRRSNLITTCYVVKDIYNDTELAQIEIQKKPKIYISCLNKSRYSLAV